MTIYILLSDVSVFRNEKFDYSTFNVYEKAFQTREEAVAYIDTIEKNEVGKLIQRWCHTKRYEEIRFYIKEDAEGYTLTKMYFSIKEETV